MCGKKILPAGVLPPGVGSPPHVREEVGAEPPARLSLRITPACAGRSPRLHAQSLFLRDHPRMCGKKETYKEINGIMRGSPPHVREEVWNCVIIAFAIGITPACAGRRGGYSCCCPQQGDHPRMCGKKYCNSANNQIFVGSPPHVREED